MQQGHEMARLMHGLGKTHIFVQHGARPGRLFIFQSPGPSGVMEVVHLQASCGMQD